MGGGKPPTIPGSRFKIRRRNLSQEMAPYTQNLKHPKVKGENPHIITGLNFKIRRRIAWGWKFDGNLGFETFFRFFSTWSAAQEGCFLFRNTPDNPLDCRSTRRLRRKPQNEGQSVIFFTAAFLLPFLPAFSSPEISRLQRDPCAMAHCFKAPQINRFLVPTKKT